MHSYRWLYAELITIITISFRKQGTSETVKLDLMCSLNPPVVLYPAFVPVMQLPSFKEWYIAVSPILELCQSPYFHFIKVPTTV
jgi:hypothetical protein